MPIPITGNDNKLTLEVDVIYFDDRLGVICCWLCDTDESIVGLTLCFRLIVMFLPVESVLDVFFSK